MNNIGVDASTRSKARIEPLKGVKPATRWDWTGQSPTAVLLGRWCALELPYSYALFPSSGKLDGGAQVYATCLSFFVVNSIFSTCGFILPPSRGAYDIFPNSKRPKQW